MKLFLTILITIFSILSAAIIHIPTDQPTIQAGISAAYNGDTVLVDPGTYLENINFNGKNLVLGSWFLVTGDTSYISQTVIDGESSGSVVTFVSGEDSTAVLSGFTITNGLSSSGGGIYFGGNSSPSLVNVTVTGNTAFNGGGIYFRSGRPNFDSDNRCNIYFNNANLGKDLYLYYSSDYNVEVILDTFTVMNPTDYYAYPIENFTFDIQQGMIEQAEADLYVTSTGNNGNSGLSWDEPLQTINYALLKILADSLNPQTVYIAPGIYSPSSNGEVFPLWCKSYVSLLGNGEDQTILDAQEENRVLFCYNVQSFSISQMTITGGLAYEGGGIYFNNSNPDISHITIEGNTAESNGGGIYCDSSNPSISDVTIIGNTVLEGGGGIYSVYSSPNLFNVTIIENTAFTGGAIHLSNSSANFTNVLINGNSAELGGGVYCSRSGSSPNFFNVTISGNSASSGGGGIYSNNSASPSLENVLVYENTASYGGGIYCGSNSSPSLINVTISGNTAIGPFSHGGGISCGSNSSLILINSVLWNNSPDEVYPSYSSVDIFFSDIDGGWEDEGNINADPLFINPNQGNFDLQAGSPCIDAGTAFFIWGDDTLVDLPDTAYFGNAPDMGAFESPYTVSVDKSEIMPTEFSLSQNYPNPFNPITTFRYDLPKNSYVRISIYDLLGRKVKTLVDQTQDVGYRTVIWNATNDYSKPVSAGVYLYQIRALQQKGGQAGEFVQTRKMILLR